MVVHSSVLKSSRLCSCGSAETTKLRMVLETVLLSDAEGAEDQVEDIVGGGGAGDFVERAQGSVEVEQEHLVWDSGGYGVGGGVERGERVGDEFLVAHAGQEAGFELDGGVSGDVGEDGGGQGGDAFAG